MNRENSNISDSDNEIKSLGGNKVEVDIELNEKDENLKEEVNTTELEKVESQNEIENFKKENIIEKEESQVEN